MLVVIDSPVVDPGVLEDLARLSNDPTFVERLICGFRSDAERILEDITTSLAARRYEEVKDAAHALLGGAASVGATQLAQIAARLDKASHDTLRLKATAWIEELTRATDVALAAFDRHLEERQRQLRS